MIKWSHSRDNDVRACERRAFLKYRYASSTATKESCRVYACMLKRAIDPTTWAGNVAHRVISNHVIPQAQRNGGSFDVQAAIRECGQLIDKQFEFSRARKFETCSRSQAGEDYCVLKAHLSDDPRGEPLKQTAVELCSRAITNLAERHFELLRLAARAAQVHTEKEIRVRVDSDLMVEAIIDMFLVARSGRAVIVDWKLWGHGGFAGDQLLVYAYVVLNCGWWPDLAVDRISAVEANLLTGNRHVLQPSSEDLRPTYVARRWSSERKPAA